MFVGIGITIPKSQIISASPLFVAPILTWSGDQSDTSPNFTAVYDINAADGNWIRLEIASDTGFTTSLAGYDHQLTAAEILANSVAITVTNLADGNWYARLRHSDVQSPLPSTYTWSNTEIVTIYTVSSSYLLRKDGISKYKRKDNTSYLLRS